MKAPFEKSQVDLCKASRVDRHVSCAGGEKRVNIKSKNNPSFLGTEIFKQFYS